MNENCLLVSSHSIAVFVWFPRPNIRPTSYVLDPLKFLFKITIGSAETTLIVSKLVVLPLTVKLPTVKFPVNVNVGDSKDPVMLPGTIFELACISLLYTWLFLILVKAAITTHLNIIFILPKKK